MNALAGAQMADVLRQRVAGEGQGDRPALIRQAATTPGRCVARNATWKPHTKKPAASIR